MHYSQTGHESTCKRRRFNEFSILIPTRTPTRAHAKIPSNAEPTMGFEPTTCWLQTSCSTIELHRQFRSITTACGARPTNDSARTVCSQTAVVMFRSKVKRIPLAQWHLYSWLRQLAISQSPTTFTNFGSTIFATRLPE